MKKPFNEIYADVVRILRRDYAGQGECEATFDPRYYNQSIGQAWHDRKLDELLFFRYVWQMFACIGDSHLRLELTAPELYSPTVPGFRVRRLDDSLFVTEAAEEVRLHVGDRITAINGGSPLHHRSAIQKNIFASDVPEREDWSGLLKMARDVTLAGGETLELRPYPKPPRTREPVFRLFGRTAYIDPGLFDGRGAAAALLQANGAALRGCRRVVWDLRRGGGDAEDDLLPLLPYLASADTTTRALLGAADLFVNYTPLNCTLRVAALHGLPGAEPYVAELREKSGRGFLRETDESEGEPVAGLAPPEVVVLTDTWCRDAGESFVLAAKNAGARLLGRPTLGTLDYCSDVRVRLDDRFILGYPTAVTAAARDGRGMKGVGVAPDEYLPWTPEECRVDRLLEAALS